MDYLTVTNVKDIGNIIQILDYNQLIDFMTCKIERAVDSYCTSSANPVNLTLDLSTEDERYVIKKKAQMQDRIELTLQGKTHLQKLEPTTEWREDLTFSIRTQQTKINAFLIENGMEARYDV